MMKSTDVKALFSVNVKRLRIQAGLTQKSLAEKTGLTQNSINDIEHGKKWVSSDSFNRLSEALEAEPLQFLLGPIQWDKQENQNLRVILDNLVVSVNNLVDNYRKANIGDCESKAE